MGQKPSTTTTVVGSSPKAAVRPKLSLAWVLRGTHTTRTPNPEQPIKFQYKTRRKSVGVGVDGPIREKHYNNLVTINNNNNDVDPLIKYRISKSECNLNVSRTKSEPSLNDRAREKHRHRRRTPRNNYQIKNQEKANKGQFGYEIDDIDAFLSKATLDKPANIPVVLAFPSVLYQTRIGGYQAEISLPLGMVVNAVFKNQSWLYVQTPHAEEGYVSYAACLPLGIIPPPDDFPAPCWEKSTDVFPKPCGNMTDTEKLSSVSDCSVSRCRSRRSRTAGSSCEEKSVDRLYLRAAASAKSQGSRQTLLVIDCDYKSPDSNTLNVSKGDVVVLVSAHIRDWFWVRTRDGQEGFIPAAIAGHGFL